MFSYTFELEKVEDPFKIRDKDSEYLRMHREGSLYMPDWSEILKNPSFRKISELFKYQIISEYVNFQILKGSCEFPKQVFQMLQKSVPLEEVKKICNKLDLSNINSPHYSSRMDVFRIDQEAMRFQQKMFTHVILSEDYEYMGHIYSWDCPSDSEAVCVIGIRGTILLPFYKIVNDKIGSVSKKIFSTVEDFCLQRGKTKILIIEPLNIMVKISSKLGFIQTKEFAGKDLGKIGNQEFGSNSIVYIKKIK